MTSSDSKDASEKRKRSQKLHKSSSDEDRSKRIKEEQPKTKKTRARGKKTKQQTGFTFNSVSEQLVTETPRMVKGQQTDEEMKDGSQTSAYSTPRSDSEFSVESVSIRDEGSRKRISKPKLRAKASRQPSGMDLADQYLTFDPREGLEDYENKELPYSLLAETLGDIEGTTKRLEIVRRLTEVFRTILVLNCEELLPAVYLSVNELAPAHEGVKLGVGNDILIKAISAASGGISVSRLKQEYNKEGDLGTLAMKKKAKHHVLKKFEPLTISGVYKEFLSIAKSAGEKSVETKRSKVERLLHASKGQETKFIIRSLLGKLRIGLAEQTVLHALAQAFYLEKTKKPDSGKLLGEMEKAVEALKLGYSQCPSYEKVIDCMSKHGVKDLGKHLHFVPGIPVQPMLAKPTTGIQEILEKFNEEPFTCEFKYDGERCQIHYLEDGKVLIYSRSSESLTGKYPDLVKRVPVHIKPGIKSVVLDCESVAYDQTEQKILPFQTLSTRAKKDVQMEDIKVKICLFCFDCLYLNGESLLFKPLVDRRKALYSALNTESGILEFAQQHTSTNVEELQSFLDSAVNQNTEGLVVKTLDCTYEPSKRSVNWLKLKKDYLETLGDSFDLVVLGAWHGKGKRTGVFGSFLLAVYDPMDDEYQTISKIGTGFSEEDLETFTRELKSVEIPSPHSNYRYGESLIPDAWFDPHMVMEVKAADMSLSPLHKAAYGIVDDQKGISIRFPRLIRVRQDKKPREATSTEQVAEMYEKQSTMKTDDV